MRIHMMGIGGSGMAGVAKLAANMGYEITGCDLEKSTAYSGDIIQGHNPKHLEGIDLLVVTPAVYFQKNKSPELIEGEKRKVVVTWEEFAGKYLAKDKKVICVAGTHGKSTTTAMTGRLLVDAGLDPTVVLGATVPEWNGNSRYGKGEYFVIEADEFNDNFLNYHPEIIVLNNIEFDHPDYFASEEEVIKSFSKFVGNLVGEKTLIVNGESEGIQKLLVSLDTADIKIIKYFPSKESLGFTLKIPGKHNIANALGVLKLAELLGIKNETIRDSLENFKGIGRRLELISDRSSVKVYDDYAHHPTAIAATISALREVYPKSKIWAIDEPHGFVRTKALLSLYKNSFMDADKVLIGPIFKARDKETFGITPEIVAKETGHKDAKGFDSFEEIKDILLRDLREGDIVLVMGAGKSYLWAREIANLLPVKFSDLTTFRVGGKINRYVEIDSEVEIPAMVKEIKKNDQPFFIIGGGSDILPSDKDFDGIVIKFSGKSVNVNFNGNEALVTAGAGMKWDDLVDYSVRNNLQGIECMSGIPGTVGAAPIQNIGAYGQELKDVFVSLKAYNIDIEKFVTFDKEDCKFDYRESIFKKKSHWQKFLITEVTLKLNKGGKPFIGYETLKNYLSENSTLLQVRNAVLKARSEKLEDPKKIGNAGSFFKNPIVSQDAETRLKKEYPEIKIFPFGKSFKVSAAWLIEQAGWKGKSYKTAAVSSRNSLILINPDGKSSASDIYDLSENIIADVFRKFGVRLEREVQLINF